MPIAGLTTREKALILAVLIAPAAAGANIRCSVIAHGCCNPYNIPPCGNLAKRANNSRRAWWKEVFLCACRRMNAQNPSKKPSKPKVFFSFHTLQTIATNFWQKETIDCIKQWSCGGFTTGLPSSNHCVKKLISILAARTRTDCLKFVRNKNIYEVN